MDWELAKVQAGSLRAITFADRLIITATVEAPTPNYVAQVVMAPMDIYPPEFRVVQLQPGDLEAQVITPIPAFGEFGALPSVKSVRVQTANGTQDVPITIVRKPQESRAAASSTTSVDQATGWSANFDYEEALTNAVRQLLNGPDDRVLAEVVRTQVVYGGFIGERRIGVTAKRIWLTD